MAKDSPIQPTPEMVDAFIMAANAGDPWRFLPEATLLHFVQEPTHTVARLVSAWDEARVIWPANDGTLPIMVAETAHGVGTLRTLGPTGVERVFNGRWESIDGKPEQFQQSGAVVVDEQSPARVAEERRRLGRLLETITREFA